MRFTFSLVTILLVNCFILSIYTKEINGYESKFNLSSYELKVDKRNAHDNMELAKIERFKKLFERQMAKWDIGFGKRNDDSLEYKRDYFNPYERPKKIIDRQRARWDIGFGKRNNNNFDTNNDGLMLYNGHERFKKLRDRLMSKWDIGFGKRNEFINNNEYLDTPLRRKAKAELNRKQQLWDLYFG